jgi:hypothetical protein
MIAKLAADFPLGEGFSAVAAGALCRIPEAITAQRGATDFSTETIAAAMHGSGYSAALIAELLAELKAAGHYDSILAEAAAAGPLD